MHETDNSLSRGQTNQLTLRRHPSNPLLILDNGLTTILPPLSYSSEQQALCFFIHQHVLPPEEPDINGHMAFLPDLLRDRLDSPCLQHAALGVSYLALGCRTGSQELHMEARRNYGKSLSSLRSILSSPNVVMDDAVFAAVLLASLFVVRFFFFFFDSDRLASRTKSTLGFIRRSRGIAQRPCFWNLLYTEPPWPSQLSNSKTEESFWMGLYSTSELLYSFVSAPIIFLIQF